jgi:uncharacterized membrane protein YkoI
MHEDVPSKDLEVRTELSDSPQKPKGTARTGGKRGQATPGSDTEARPTKKKKASKANLALPPQVVQPKTKKVKAAPEPRDELPRRKGCNNHPGVVVQPKPKRTSAQVAKEKVAQQAVKERLAELEEEKKRLYAQMEIDEDNRDLEHEVNAIRRLSDIARPRATNKDAVLSEGEEFDMNVDMSDSDSNGERPEKKEEVSSSFPIHIVLKLTKYLTLERCQGKGLASSCCSCEGCNPW